MESYKCITINKKQVRLHRYVIEQNIERKLKPNEIVHHIDGNKENNILSNLTITNRGKHMQIHKIGENSQYKTRYIIDIDKLFELYTKKKLPIWKVAKKLKASYNSVWRAIKKNNIKRNIICQICGMKAHYTKDELCYRCYQRIYQRGYRAKTKRV